MLPLDQAWYRKLLASAVLLGLAAGVLVLLYSAVTSAGTEQLSADAGIGWWSGEWWWIPLTAVGGLVVVLLRRWWEVPAQVPGSVTLIGEGWVDPVLAPRLVAISVVSIIFGASLGPSFGLVIIGGGLGAWVVSRLGIEDEEARQEYVLTGMAAGLGSAFSAPVFGAVLTSEISPTAKRQYVAAFIPQLIAATLGFIVFFGITRSTMLGAFDAGTYQLEFTDIPIAAGLGVIAAIVLFVFVGVTRLVSLAASRVANPLVRGVGGGALVGLIAFALPLTIASGSSQLATVIDNNSALAIGFLVFVLLGKMAAVSISLAAGFLGGNVFPMIFVGGTSGVLVHLIFPDIPLVLAVSAMMAAVPGAFLEAPLSLTMIAVGSIGLGATAVPVAVAVVVSYLFTAVVRFRLGRFLQRDDATR
jgi:H+/Cl- antiporter ClcA